MAQSRLSDCLSISSLSFGGGVSTENVTGCPSWCWGQWLWLFLGVTLNEIVINQSVNGAVGIADEDLGRSYREATGFQIYTCNPKGALLDQGAQPWLHI